MILFGVSYEFEASSRIGTFLGSQGTCLVCIGVCSRREASQQDGHLELLTRLCPTSDRMSRGRLPFFAFRLVGMFTRKGCGTGGRPISNDIRRGRGGGVGVNLGLSYLIYTAIFFFDLAACERPLLAKNLNGTRTTKICCNRILDFLPLLITKVETLHTYKSSFINSSRHGQV